MTEEKNPHDIIELIGKPKPWRQRASIILIQLWEDRRYTKWLLASLFTLDVFIIGLLLKIVFNV